LRRPQQQRVDACEIDVNQRDLQRLAGVTEATLRGNLLNAAGESESFHGNHIVLVLDRRPGARRELPLLSLRLKREPLQVDLSVTGCITIDPAAARDRCGCFASASKVSCRLS
jgi:hypothetical protein